MTRKFKVIYCQARLLAALVCLCHPWLATGQAFCPNSDFSSGNFSFWQGFYGDFDNPAANTGFVTTNTPRHLIIPAPGYKDPDTDNGLTTIPPGESFCARLGNDSIGGQAEELSYTFQVTNENSLFIYKYAVVLQDPGHIPSHQPSFTIEVKNKDGVLFDPVCGYYYVYAQPGLPGWHTCHTSIDTTTVVWKDWTTVGLNLSELIGQAVTIVFTTRDCEEKGHFGYAYLSTHCDKLQLQVGFCIENSTVTVTAPPGFSYLWNTGDTTQSISIANPTPGMVDSCRLTSVNGCQVTISATILPTLLSAGFDFIPQCALVPVSFTDQSSVNQNSIVNWRWDFGDGTTLVIGSQNPEHSFANSGTFNVSLVAYSSDQCTDTITKSITIEPSLAVDLGKDITVRWGSTTRLDAGNPGARYLWSTGETTQVINAAPEQIVWVSVQNDYCMASDTIVIHEFPRCIVDVPTAFSPNGDYQNDVLYVMGGGLSSFEFMIFDRSGEMVFRSENQSEGWDGTFQGKPLGMGVFNYILKGICVDGDPFFKKGNITLLR